MIALSPLATWLIFGPLVVAFFGFAAWAIKRGDVLADTKHDVPRGK